MVKGLTTYIRQQRVNREGRSSVVSTHSSPCIVDG